MQEVLRADNEQETEPRFDRRRSDAPRPELVQPAPPSFEAQRAERRGMEALRAEALQKVISRVEDRNFGGLRNNFQWRGRMKLSRVLLVLVALMAGGTAAFLAIQGQAPTPSMPVVEAAIAPVAPAPVQPAGARILVASQEIGIGQRLTETSVEWVDWPTNAVRPGFITVADAPEAIAEMTGTLARQEFIAGEPIRAEKLVSAEDGYLSAVLETGKRGVSVMVSAESASGGFIVPNDHVDVVLTLESGGKQSSETILHNARVLAINSRLGETGTTGAPADPEDPRAEVFVDKAMATLELDQTQAEVIISASQTGRLTLVLRSMTDFGEAGTVEQRPTNAAIRMTSPFWANESPGGLQ